ncbi:MAG: sulfotransferase [Phycisphaerales bacterium]
MSSSGSKLDMTLQRAAAALKQEHLGSALTLYRKALSMDKNNPKIMFRLGQVLLAAGFADEAIEVLKKAAKRRANHLDTLVVLSQAQLLDGDIDAMQATLEKALSRDPTYGPAVAALVNSFLDSGKTEQAQGVIQRVGDLTDVHPLVQMAQGRIARESKEYEKAEQLFASLIAQDEVPDRYKRSARFELGSVLDSTEQYDRAFECFELANAGHSDGRMSHLESLKSTWSPEVLSTIPVSTIREERPVIIAGMPRSGTTLTERVINAHPLGASVGECPLLLQMMNRTLASNLDQTLIDLYASQYISMLDSSTPSSATRVIDKHMGTEKDLGLISKVLPGVRVIHAIRDPRDCCLSAYFQNFGTNVPYSRDLGMLGRQYAVHREMMDYWSEHLDIPIYTNVYEEFVSDPDAHTRAMLEFLGLEFDEACLRFHEAKDHVHTASSTQVRKPVYQSSKQRWKNYEKYLAPLLEGLGEYAQGVHGSHE